MVILMEFLPNSNFFLVLRILYWSSDSLLYNYDGLSRCIVNYVKMIDRDFCLCIVIGEYKLKFVHKSMVYFTVTSILYIGYTSTSWLC